MYDEQTGTHPLMEPQHTLFSNGEFQPTHYTSMWKTPVHVDMHGNIWQKSVVPSTRGQWLLDNEIFGWPYPQTLVRIDWADLPLFAGV